MKETTAEWVLINFRLRPRERRELRIALLQQGMTFQDYFGAIVQRELTNIRQGLFPEVSQHDTEGDREEKLHVCQYCPHILKAFDDAGINLKPLDRKWLVMLAQKQSTLSYAEINKLIRIAERYVPPKAAAELVGQLTLF